MTDHTKDDGKPLPTPMGSICKACADPENFKRHSCGLKDLQDLLRF